jgi:hypothetical protein
MISIITDNILIYAFLEKTGNLPVHFNFDKVFDLENEDDFYVIIYTSSDRNFVCFKAANFIQQDNILIELRDAVQEYSYNDTSSLRFINKALQLIEEKMHTKNNARYYFDAH